jgi:Putative F0F1-ATPase subunit Ca2+/Mg2+ transporter
MKTNKWIQFITIPSQMGVTIYLFHLLGLYMHQKYPTTENWFHKGAVLFGVFLALYIVIKQVNKLGNEK